jgi:hypothetical protein
MHRDYAAGAEGPPMRARYAAVTTPIVSLSFADDEYMSLANTKALHRALFGSAADHEAHRTPRHRPETHRPFRLLPRAAGADALAPASAAGAVLTSLPALAANYGVMPVTARVCDLIATTLAAAFAPAVQLVPPVRG